MAFFRLYVFFRKALCDYVGEKLLRLCFFSVFRSEKEYGSVCGADVYKTDLRRE